jgi:hypothetical protein
MPEQTEIQEIKPQQSWKRNALGLIEGIEHKFTADGRVDWRAMVPKEFLVVNKQNFKNRALPTSIEGLEDKDLLILLGGIKYVAALRGYDSVYHDVTFHSENAVGVKTTINWIPNYETDDRSVTFESLADATCHNTSSFAKVYLSATAENRGFVRAVRNSLGINVCGQDEIGRDAASQTESESQTPDADSGIREMLSSTLEKHGITFDKFQNRMIALEQKGEAFAVGSADWKSASDVNAENIFKIISFINEGVEKKKKLKSEVVNG